MATNPSTPEQRKVVSVEILHLDEKGYGPQGTNTRREWRKECLDNFLAGKAQFAAWQANWMEQVDKSLPMVSLSYQVNYDDGFSEEIQKYFFEKVSPLTLDFVAHTFEQTVIANNFTFIVNADFSFTTFCRAADFSSSKISGDVNFTNSTFSRAADFSNSKISGDAHFTSSTFSGSADFYLAAFSGDADFNSSKISGDAIFTSSTFSRAADFSNSKISGDAHFRSAAFSGDAHFTSSTFSGSADFYLAAFSGHADFRRAAFSGNASFIRAAFNRNASFSSAAFSGDAYFQSATFVKDANFFKVLFKNQCRFDNKQNRKTQVWEKESKFGGAVDFENAIFDNVGHFERVRFLNETPKFRGCKIGDTRLEFSDDSYFPQDEKGEDAIKNISFLKRLAEEHGQTDQALNFNAMELRAKMANAELKFADVTFSKRIRNADWWYAKVTGAYKMFSDFGRSFTKPLKYYGALLLLTFILALMHSAHYAEKKCNGTQLVPFSTLWREQLPCEPVTQKAGEDKVIPLSGWRAALEYTTFRASGILDFADSDKQTMSVARRLFDESIEPLWMRIYGIVKAIASTALLFLAALGLRNKYRIK